MTDTQETEVAILNLLKSLRKRGAVRRYLKALPRKLYQDYGHRGPYTPGQVESTLRRYKVSSPDCWPYALAIFCDQETLRQARREMGPDHEALRREVAATCFGGDDDFTTEEVARHWSDGGGQEGSGGHSGHGGGDHGGDGGGGHH